MSDDSKDARLGGKRKSGALPPKKPEKSSHFGNTIFNLVIIGFIGYGVFNYIAKGGDAGILSELGEKFDIIEVPYQEGDPRIDRLQHRQRVNALGRMFPKERPAVKIETLREGSGPPATCGQKATYRLVEGVGEDKKAGEPDQFQLGQVDLPQGLTLGVEGMRVGEIRRLLVPQELWEGTTPAEGLRSQVTGLAVELLALEPAVPQAEMPLRRFLIRGGGGFPLRCGDLAILHLVVWGNEGEKLFDSTETGKPVYFFLGEGKVPYGLERGVMSMASGGLYSLALAPQLQKPLYPEAAAEQEAFTLPFEAQPFPQDLALPEGQIVLVDIDYPEEAPRQVLPAASAPDTEPVKEPVINQPAE